MDVLPNIGQSSRHTKFFNKSFRKEKKSSFKEKCHLHVGLVQAEVITHAQT